MLVLQFSATYHCFGSRQQTTHLVTKGISFDNLKKKKTPIIYSNCCSFFRCLLICKMRFWWVCWRQIQMWWITSWGEKHHSELRNSFTRVRSAVCFFLGGFLSYFSSILTHRSPDLLQTEEPFTLSERRSSSDSNKASSGEVSPYDNNSPVLSERRGEPGSPGSEQLFRVPEQYSLVGQVAGWSREPGAETWGSKGELMTYVSLAFFPTKLAVCPWTVFFCFV